MNQSHEFPPLPASTLTPEQAAILSLLDRIEVLEKRLAALDGYGFSGRQCRAEGGPK